jgi:hypothetical protein
MMLVLIKIISLLGAPPSFAADFPGPSHLESIDKGRKLRARLPAYLEQRRALTSLTAPFPRSCEKSSLRTPSLRTRTSRRAGCCSVLARCRDEKCLNRSASMPRMRHASSLK